MTPISSLEDKKKVKGKGRKKKGVYLTQTRIGDIGSPDHKTRGCKTYHQSRLTHHQVHESKETAKFFHYPKVNKDRDSVTFIEKLVELSIFLETIDSMYAILCSRYCKVISAVVFPKYLTN